MFNNPFLLAFAVAFMGCVFTTPLVTRFAAWAGAIDRPDQFRRIHRGEIPRLGGLGLALGLLLSVSAIVLGGHIGDLIGVDDLRTWWTKQVAIFLGAGIVLVVGVIDDTKGMSPRIKLLGQAAAVLVLFFGGIQANQVMVLGHIFDLSHPGLTLHLGGHDVAIGLPALALTMFWFLGCMNVWNLIDGMDGLASGVGVLVSGTLMMVALWQGNVASAILAASLAGSLAGFLLYNWHPACIFLGDSGSLLIGLLIGVIGVQDSLKGPSAVTILFPILAMGLPISDTAMAIFRRWVRNLPLSSADRRHVHHLLIGLGLNPRQAAIYLYIFSAFLCGVVLLGVSLHNEALALILGLSGCLAFLLILTSRRDELAQLRDDLRARMLRGRQERLAAKATWDVIQRIELCEDPERIWELMLETARAMGCDMLRLTCYRQGRAVLRRSSKARPIDDVGMPDVLSGPTATFRLPSGQDLILTMSVHQATSAAVAADIAFRFLQRLALATAERLERLLAAAPPLPLPDGEGLAAHEDEVLAPSGALPPPHGLPA